MNLFGVITYIFQILFAQHLKWHVRMSIWEAALLWLAVLAVEGSRRSRQRQVVWSIIKSRVFLMFEAWCCRFSQAENTQRWLFFCRTPLAPEKKHCLFINNFDMTPIPLKTMTPWSLEFNQQPSTKFFSFCSFFTWDRCPNGPCIALHSASKQVQFLIHGEGDMQWMRHGELVRLLGLLSKNCLGYTKKCVFYFPFKG